MAVAGLVLAAGGSSRFGSPNQLAEFAGRPLIAAPIAAVAASPSVTGAAVALGPEPEADVDEPGDLDRTRQ